jgi:IS1 family transposase
LTVADAQQLFGHSKVTIRLWLTRAGQHAEKVHVHFFQNLTLGHVQLDELYTTWRDKAHDLWVWVAFDPATKLLPALQLGSRTQDLAFAFLHALSQVLAPGCLPVFTSDGLNLYFYALTAHFGQWFTHPATSKTRWQVACHLLYAQVKKTYRRRKLYRVERLMHLGELAQLTQRLKTLGLSGSLNTAFVERLNLTLRHALAALSRRSWATAQLTGELHTHLEWWRAYPQGAFGSYHFCRPHSSLRPQLDVPQLRRGKQPHAGMRHAPRRWRPVSPITSGWWRSC